MEMGKKLFSKNGLDHVKTAVVIIEDLFHPIYDQLESIELKRLKTKLFYWNVLSELKI